MNRSELIMDLGFIQIWLLLNHPIFKDGYYWKEGTTGLGPHDSHGEALLSYENEVKRRKSLVKKIDMDTTNKVISVDFNVKCRIDEKT